MSLSSIEAGRGETHDRDRSRRALISALSDPDTYGGVPVVVHETHASWVLVAGACAYKVKKPLALGFLDYSTPALRRRACIEEVRVNQELAPGIYVGVRAIVRVDGGFAFSLDDETPDAVDYAVEMRSFDEAGSLAGLIASSTLTSEHLQAVASRLASFHRTAPVVAGGGVAQELAVWRRNVAELRQAARPVGLASGPAESESFAEMFVRLNAHELERRRADGMVCDVHGDLRCEHVLAIPSVRIVDRIEFDPSLRHTDIACDVAFLAMDLEAHGQRWAARELVSAYRGSGMDPGSDALRSFHGAHRALVRAKVALIAAAEHDDERAPALHAQARSMLLLAELLCWRARGPVAIVICGPSATGKSTLAAELSKRSGLEVLSSDATRKRAAGLEPTDLALASTTATGSPTASTSSSPARRTSGSAAAAA